jgi:hypothetical protein
VQLLLLMRPHVMAAFGGLAKDQVRTFTSGSHASWLQWLQCAEAENAPLHAFTRHGRRSWRNPPLQGLCCFPAHGRCFRAVFDDQVEMEVTSSTEKELRQLYAKQILEILRRKFDVHEVRLSNSRIREYRSDEKASPLVAEKAASSHNQTDQIWRGKWEEVERADQRPFPSHSHIILIPINPIPILLLLVSNHAHPIPLGP